MGNDLLILTGAYLLGSIPFSYLIARLKGETNLSAKGSGNLGGTNAIRVLGWAPGIAAGLLDIGKAFGAVWLADLLSASEFLPAITALVVTAGHNWSVLFLGKKGGKGISTTIGSFTYLSPLITGGALLIALLVVLFTRFVSLGSLIFVTLLALGLLIIKAPPAVIVAAVILGIVAFWRHRENIGRLRRGVERKIGEKV
jgi:glycerol-3-phosphate acyltransferase PlsY